MEYARFWPPVVPHMSEIMEIWEDELDAAYFDEKTLKKACDTIVQKTNELLRNEDKK